MALTIYHIVPRYDGTWFSIRDNNGRVSVRARTLEETIARTMDIARRWHALVQVHHKNGRVVQVPLAA